MESAGVNMSAKAIKVKYEPLDYVGLGRRGLTFMTLDPEVPLLCNPVGSENGADLLSL